MLTAARRRRGGKPRCGPAHRRYPPLPVAGPGRWPVSDR